MHTMFAFVHQNFEWSTPRAGQRSIYFHLFQLADGDEADQSHLPQALTQVVTALLTVAVS